MSLLDRILRRTPRRPGQHVVPAARHPYQLLVLASLAVIAIVNVRFVSHRVDEIIPTWAALLWSTLLTMGCIFALMAAWWKDKVMAMLVERAGHTSIATVCLSYGIALLVAYGPATLAGYMTLGIGVASTFRARDVNHELRMLRSFMQQVDPYKEEIVT